MQARRSAHTDTAGSQRLIRTAGRKIEGPIDAATVTFGMVALALGIGFIVGLLVFGLMKLSGWLTAAVWGGFTQGEMSWWFPLIVCIAGGLIIGVWTYFSGNRVDSLEHVMGTFRRTGSYRTDGAVKPVVSFLLPLTFGGSVGFEAGLTGIITSCCCWIRDKLKEAGLRNAVVADVTIAATLSAIFNTPLAGIAAGAESAPGAQPRKDVDGYTFSRPVKIVLYTASAFGAFAGIAAISAISGASGGLPRFDSMSVDAAGALWAIPCLLVGWLMAVLFHSSQRFFGEVAARASKNPVSTIYLPVIAGLTMGVVAIVFPYVLFPGETQTHELMTTWGSIAALALMATGLLKAVITPMCIKLGWMGGTIFPSIFAGVAVGYGLAGITGADPVFMITITTSAYLAGVTRKPLLTLGILALCFPLDGILWSGLAVVIGASLPLPANLIETSTLKPARASHGETRTNATPILDDKEGNPNG